MSDGSIKNVQAYDISDMQALDKNKSDGISGVATLAHEIYEAYQYQDQGEKDFKKAHNAALKVQGDVDGYSNVQNNSVEGSSVMNVTYTTSGGRQMRTDLPYSNNNFTGVSTTTDITPPPPPPAQPKVQLNGVQQLNRTHNSDRLVNTSGGRSAQPMGGW